ncbi:MAG: hypothetical protein Q7U50_08550 [Candidatus Nitrotoga sp.]|nr:hypothetical protein [Candidatus Nitrotoga sp.]MDP3498306.1 hypothetical protein [Candidatus Nitrotoga sp.]
MIEVKFRDETVEWASRCLASNKDIIEIPQVQALSDFLAATTEYTKIRAK